MNQAIDAETKKTVLTEPQCTMGCLAPSWLNDSTLVYTDPQNGIMTTSIISGSASLILGPTGVYYNPQKNATLPIEHQPEIQSSMASSDGNRIAYVKWRMIVGKLISPGRMGQIAPASLARTISRMCCGMWW